MKRKQLFFLLLAVVAALSLAAQGGTKAPCGVVEMAGADGKMLTLRIPGIYDIWRLVVDGDRATALGTTLHSQNGKLRRVPCLVELARDPRTGRYRYTIECSSWDEEEFVDLVTENGKTVLITRNANPDHYMLNRHYIGRRYATTGNFLAESDTVFFRLKDEPRSSVCCKEACPLVTVRSGLCPLNH